MCVTIVHIHVHVHDKKSKYFLPVDYILLAAIHYNFNSNRKQAVTSRGQKQFTVSFPKYKKGGHIVRKVKTSINYG